MKKGSVILCAAGFLLGLLATRLPAWAGGSVDGANKGVPARESLSSSQSRAAGETSAGSRAPRNLKGLVRRLQELKKGDPVMVREVERLDAAALKQLIAGLAEEMKQPPANGSQAFRELLNLATRQFFKLEGEQAMPWAVANIAAPPASDMVMTALVNAAAHDSPELAKRWKKECEARGRNRFFYYEGFSANAAEGGAEEAMRLHRLMGGLPYGFGTNGFPDDFDFHRLFVGAATEPNGGGWSYVNALAQTFIYWSRKDPEAAWKGIAEVMKANVGAEFLVADHVEEMQARHGTDGAFKFLAEHIDDIPKKARPALLNHQCFRFPYAAVDLIPLLPDVDDRMSLAGSYLDPRNHPDDTLRALHALGPEQLQAEVLLISAKELAVALKMNGEREVRRAYFTQVLEQSGISPERKAQIEAALSEPEAE